MTNASDRNCPSCGVDISHMSIRAIYCSVACRKWVANGNTGLRIVTLECCECGGLIPNPKMGKKFCSKLCKWREVEGRRVRDDAARYLRERDKRIANALAYAKKNPHVGQATKRKRKALKSKNGVFRFTSRDWQRCLNLYDNRCFYCGADGKMTMEHVMPLIRGGTHSVGNIVPACVSCNCHKQARTVMEWRYNKKRG